MHEIFLREKNFVDNCQFHESGKKFFEAIHLPASVEAKARSAEPFKFILFKTVAFVDFSIVA